MTEAALLTRDEVADLTGKVRHKAQHRALVKMGVRHALRPDGSPVVARSVRDKLLGGPPGAPAPAPVAGGEMNLAALLVDGRKAKRRP